MTAPENEKTSSSSSSGKNAKHSCSQRKPPCLHVCHTGIAPADKEAPKTNVWWVIAHPWP